MTGAAGAHAAPTQRMMIKKCHGLITADGRRRAETAPAGGLLGEVACGFAAAPGALEAGSARCQPARLPRLDRGLVRPRGASSRGHVVADRAKSAQPLPRSRSAKVDDYDRVGSTSREYIENFGEGKQLVSDFMHPGVAIYDVNLVGLQRILPASIRYYYGA
jgi:hypothetical protein